MRSRPWPKRWHSSTTSFYIMLSLPIDSARLLDLQVLYKIANFQVRGCHMRTNGSHWGEHCSCTVQIEDNLKR